VRLPVQVVDHRTLATLFRKCGQGHQAAAGCCGSRRGQRHFLLERCA